MEGHVYCVVYCVVYRPVGSVGELQGSRSGSMMAMMCDSTRHSNDVSLQYGEIFI